MSSLSLFDNDLICMICMRGGFVIQRHNELRDLEPELLNMVYKDVATEPLLQDIRDLKIQGPVSRKPRNVSGPFRVT